MRSEVRLAVRALRWLFPVRWLLVAFVLLTATGVALHRMERFGGLEWGLTEISHVWIGWASLVVWIGYLVHHVVVKWGPWSSLQRWLGVVLVVLSFALLGTGVMLAVGMDGGPPDWAIEVHWYSTWSLSGLIVWHTFVAWKRWPKQLRRRIVEGPMVPREPPPDRGPVDAPSPGASDR